MIVPPPIEAFTNKERQLINTLRTPQQVQQFLTAVGYNREPHGATLRSFRQSLRHGRVHCLEAAIIAAAVLEQHGYPPLLLSLESQDKLDHVLFVFQQRGRWGSVARSRDLGLHGRRPVFRSLRDLTWSYFDPYVDSSGRITGYGLGNLYDLGNYDWRFASHNVWKVENWLREIPHRRLRSSQLRYERLYQRYRDFKQHHPNRPPDYYSGKERWMI